MSAITNNQIELTPNTDPTNIAFKQTIILSTVDQNNNNAALAEGFIVSGPSLPSVTPIFLQNGTKAVIALSTASGNGAPYLKIHFPTSTNVDKVYITYCVANSFMADGFYDYKTGVPTSYYNALRSWINTNPSTGQAYTNVIPVVRTRSLKFSAYGNATNKPANAVTFFASLQGTFGTALTSSTTLTL